MSVESPANIAIIGLNPLSVEAGLYARFLGYSITLYGNQFCPQWSMSDQPLNGNEFVTTLGLRAIQAHHPTLDMQEFVAGLSTHQKYLEDYVLAVTKSDLLNELVVENCQGVQVKVIEDELPEDADDDVEYDTRIFELASQRMSPEESSTSSQMTTADVLVDMRYGSEREQIAMSTEFEIQLDSSSRMTPAMTANLTNGQSSDPKRLFTSVDDFYVLGPQSLAKDGNDGHAVYLQQIIDLFKIICDREELNLYSS